MVIKIQNPFLYFSYDMIRYDVSRIKISKLCFFGRSLESLATLHRRMFLHNLNAYPDALSMLRVFEFDWPLDFAYDMLQISIDHLADSFSYLMFFSQVSQPDFNQSLFLVFI